MSEFHEMPEEGNDLSGKVFKDYYESNMRLPQSHLAITVFTENSVLAHPNLDWREFANSQFSEKHLNKVGAAMTNVHRSHGVAIAAENRASDSEKPVSENRFQQLWTTVKGETIDGAYRYSLYATGKKDEALRPGAPRITESKLQAVETFWENPQNQDSILKLQSVMAVAKDTLRNNPKLESSIQNFKSQVASADLEQKRLMLKDIGDQIRTEVVDRLGEDSGEIFDIFLKNFNS